MTISIIAFSTYCKLKVLVRFIMYANGGIGMEEKEISNTESLLSMIIDRTFEKHGVEIGSVTLSTVERKKLLETVRILQNQAERFLKKPVIKTYSGTGTGARKFVPNKMKD